MLDRTLTAFLSHGRIDNIILTYAKEDKSKFETDSGQKNSKVQAVLGGATRFDSVKNALKAAKNCDIVLIHDGARPFVTHGIIDDAIDSAIKYGSGIASTPLIDTVKAAENGIIISTPNRAGLYAAQTPQAFKYDLINKAYEAATRVCHGNGSIDPLSKSSKSTRRCVNATVPVTYSFTDDASVLEWYGIAPRLSSGSPENIKVTTVTDLAKLPSYCRIGLGYDVHRFAKDRKLILGGIEIPYPFGLLGHSDADVLTHAIMDALLSAAGLPDIGVLFPDTDNAYKGADSVELLKQVVTIARRGGVLPPVARREAERRPCEIVNISCVVMAEAPKLAPHIQKMRARLADTLNIKIDQINISATTTEGLGITAAADENSGIAASCNVLVKV